MTIKEFSALIGVSAHTLRYYEKIGLLRHIVRNNSGHRIYTNRDAEWLRFILRLKDTGMPLENILQYAELRAQGPSTTHLRQMLLEKHRKQLRQHIQRQTSHLTMLEDKIQLYKEQKVH
jgi:DNA-binding transcriptional MerR regulator